jgi:hypothetical protein
MNSLKNIHNRVAPRRRVSISAEEVNARFKEKEKLNQDLKIVSFGRVSNQISYSSVREAFKTDPQIKIATKKLLSQLYDTLKCKDAHFEEGVDEEVCQAILKYPKIIIEKDFQPPNNDWTDAFTEEGKINLPFPKICVIAGYMHDAPALNESYVNRFSFYTVSQDFNGILISAFLCAHANSPLHVASIRLEVSADIDSQVLGIYPIIPQSQAGWMDDEMIFVISDSVLRAIYMMTYHTGEAYVSIPTPRDIEVNQKKLRKNTSPVIEFRLISITGKERPNIPSTTHETHASPRQHWRRGHWRSYKSGKRAWVEPMLVGDEANGKIIKDYAVGNYKEKRYDWASQTK